MEKTIKVFGYDCVRGPRGTYCYEDDENKIYIEVYVPPNQSTRDYNIKLIDDMCRVFVGIERSIKLAELNLMSKIINESCHIKNLYDELNSKVTKSDA